MIKKVKNYLFALFDLIDSFLYDCTRYVKYSATLNRWKSKTSARASILMSAHSLEKGLALPGRKEGFGKDRCYDLLDAVKRFGRVFGPDPVTSYAIEVVEATVEFHLQTGDEDLELVKMIEALRCVADAHFTSLGRVGGLIECTNTEILSLLPEDPYGFFNARHSVRQFSGAKIGVNVIEEAARIAQTAPSVCNRQSCRIYWTDQKHLIDLALSLQGGARGFVEDVATLCIIVSDAGAFNRGEERNQQWVDGGIYAMTFALAFHSMGYGACFLNWSKSARTDRLLRKMFSIFDEETVITFLAVGGLLERFQVASSPRLPTGDVTRPLTIKEI